MLSAFRNESTGSGRRAGFRPGSLHVGLAPNFLQAQDVWLEWRKSRAGPVGSEVQLPMLSDTVRLAGAAAPKGR